MVYKSNMQVNFGRIFVNKDILGSSDYSNTNTYLKIVHPTSRGGDGVVIPPKTCFTQKMEGLKTHYKLPV